MSGAEPSEAPRHVLADYLRTIALADLTGQLKERRP